MAAMAASRTVFPLADCHPSILQRIIDRCDRQDLFLLRQVARRFRDAVDQRISRLRPGELPADLGSKFPGLVSLDMLHCSRDCAMARVAPLLLLPQLPQLRELLELKLDGSDLPFAPAWLPFLRALTQLTRLRFRGVADAAVFPAVAAHCHSLQQLELAMCRLDWGTLQSTFAHVAGTLTELDLVGHFSQVSGMTAVTGALPPLAMLPLNTRWLRTLSLAVEQVGPVDALFSQLAVLTGLSSLELFGSEQGGDGLEQLNALTRLTRLHLDNVGVTCADVSRLTRLTRVSDLGLRYLNGQPAPAAPPGDAAGSASLSAALAGFPGLTCLDISYCDFVEVADREVGSALSALSGLTRLVADAAKVISGPEALCGLSLLQGLALADTLKHESQLCHLSGLVSLTSLHLHDDWETAEDPPVMLSELGGRWLATLKKLQELFIDNELEVKAGAIEQLAGLSHLSGLSLLGNKGQPPSMAPLQRLPLEWLLLPEGHSQVPAQLRVAAARGQRFAWSQSKYQSDLAYSRDTQV